MNKIIRLGLPAFPVKITEHGTFIAKLEHVWQAARRYAKRNGYKIVETYGVIGVAPFWGYAAGAWFTYLKVPFDEPLELYQLDDKRSSWMVEWIVK